MVEYHGEFPVSYEAIRSLKGIGSYTAGAISSFAYGLAEPAVDGNVLRVVTRLLADGSDIMKQGTKTRFEQKIRDVIPKEHASDFNQGLIELGAIVCVPNGAPKCEECPLAHLCRAKKEGRMSEFPVKTRAKARRIEEKTILLFRDEENIAISKRGEGFWRGSMNFRGFPGTRDVMKWRNTVRRLALCPSASESCLPPGIYSAMWNGI